MDKIKLLEDKIKQASENYYSGNSTLSDKEFDALVEELEKLNPNSDILSKLELHKDWNYDLENLPYKLYSIKKVKDWKDIKNWIKYIQEKINNEDDNIELILTLKYDGIKLLYFDKKYYTRYETGDKGYNVSNRIKDNNFKNFEFGTEGELIISKENFKNYCSGYKSSRNFIPAIFSSKNKVECQDKIEYIRYSLYGENFNLLDKEEQIKYCNSLNNIKIPYLKIKYKDLTEQKIINFYFENVSEFECDGVVIDINSSKIRTQLGETQKYLDCCRAYKGDALFDDIKESKIINIVWQMSRYSKLTPVAQINPVLINEGLVSNVSLYNASYICENNIFKGQRIKVTRKGKINPKIVEFLDKGEKDLIEICPFCGAPLRWENNSKGEKIDLICPNEECLEKKVQNIYFFLKTIGIKDFGVKIIRNILKHNKVSLIDFIDEQKFFSIPLVELEGIGIKTKNSFITQLKKIKEEEINLEIIQEASGVFQGIGQSTLRVLNTLNVDMELYFNDNYYKEIWNKGLTLEGIKDITLKLYLDGLYNFYIKGYYENYIKSYFHIKNKKNNNQQQRFLNKNICFTGFRNENWSKIIEEEGGKVLSNVTSTCNILVAKDINSTSSKIKKAKEIGIQILSIEDFSKLI